MSVPRAQLFGTTNPDNPAHWLKHDYLDRLAELPGWRSFAFTLDYNPSLTSEYRESIQREYTGLWFRRFILGEWVAAQCAVFDIWDPDGHVVPWAELPDLRRLLAAGSTTAPRTQPRLCCSASAPVLTMRGATMTRAA